MYPFLSLLRKQSRDPNAPSRSATSESAPTAVEPIEPEEDADEFHSAEENLDEQEESCCQVESHALVTKPSSSLSSCTSESSDRDYSSDDICGPDLESRSSSESADHSRSDTSVSSTASSCLWYEDKSKCCEGDAGKYRTSSEPPLAFGKATFARTTDQELLLTAAGDQFVSKKLYDKIFNLGRYLSLKVPPNIRAVKAFPITYIRKTTMNPEPTRLEARPSATAVTKKYEHAWHTLDQLYTLYKSGKLSDIVICVDQVKFACHKAILASHSEYFERIFADSNFHDLNQDQLVLNANVTPTAFEHIIHYIYTSEIEITYDTIYDILTTASLLLMKRLVKTCTDFLRNFDFDHCLTALYIADRCGLKDIYAEIFSFVAENFLEVADLEEFRRYPPERLTRLLADDDLCVENEMQVFHVALRWIEENGELGHRYAPAIMQQIRFGLMAAEEIVQGVESVEFLMNIPDCHILVLEAYRYFSLRACHKGTLRPHPINPRRGMNKVRSARRASIAIPDDSVSHIRKIGVPTPFAIASKMSSKEDNRKSREKMAEPAPWPLQDNRSASSTDKEYILSTGGINNAGDVDNPGRVVNLFDPVANRWSKMTEMPYARNHHAAKFANGYLYVIGGSDPNAESDKFMTPMSTVCRYDVANKKWEEMAPMKTGRIFFQMAVLFGQLYVVGGQDAKGRVLSSVERYDSVTNTWRYAASLSSPRYAVSVAPHRGMLFAVGGYCDNGKAPVVGTVECYDPHNDIWTEKNPLRYARCHACMADAVGRLYLFGGMVKTGYSDEDCQSLPSVDVYSDDSDSWEYVTDLSEARHEASVSVIGTKIYIIGGISAMEKHILSSVECYDALVGQWQLPAPPSLAKPAFGHSSCVMAIKKS